MAKHVSELTVADVSKVYSGRPGCGCGCRGKYSETGPNVKRVLSVLQTAAKVEVQEDATETIYALETEKRFFWVYVPKSAAVSS